MSEEKKVEETAAEEKQEVVVPEKFKSIVQEIEKMSVLDLSELVKILEDKFGVSTAAPMMMGSMPVVAGTDEKTAAEEKSEFNVELTLSGDNKIGVIKAVRELTEIGLKDAKDLVESAPTIIKEGVKREDAEAMKKKIEEVGGSITLK